VFKALEKIGFFRASRPADAGEPQQEPAGHAS
jgi:hypothetical protein